MCDCLNCSDITIPTGSTGATGPAGPAGANGTNGVDGVSVLFNTIIDTATTGTGSFETLSGKTYTIPANKLSTNGDMIHIRSRFKPTTKGGQCQIAFNGSSVGTLGFTNSLAMIEIDTYITRYSSTQAKYETIRNANILSFLGYSSNVKYISIPTTVGGLDWTTTYTLTSQGNSTVIGDVICELMQVTFFKKS